MSVTEEEKKGEGRVEEKRGRGGEKMKMTERLTPHDIQLSHGCCKTRIEVLSCRLFLYAIPGIYEP